MRVKNGAGVDDLHGESDHGGPSASYSIQLKPNNAIRVTCGEFASCKHGASEVAVASSPIETRSNGIS